MKGIVPASRDELNILVVRPDRLGDVILSTPVFEVIKQHYPKARIIVMVRESLVPIIQGNPFVDHVIVYDPLERHGGVKGFFRLISDFRALKVRIALVLQSERSIAGALYLARVRYRVGPFSKPHSFLFFNRGVRQRRSHVEMHETDYNLQLLRKLGIRVGTRNIPTRVSISEAARDYAREWLLAQGWNGVEPLVAVHPGMGGSALNWPETHYIEFIRGMLRQGRKTIVTAGPQEADLLVRIKEGLGKDAARTFFYGGADALGIENLGGIFSFSSLVVAPSTGPLHLAVALGKSVVSFFPPVRVQSAIRWGPYTANESKTKILVPEVYCGQDFACLGSLCNYYPCMKTLTVTQALEQANWLLSRTEDVKNA